MKRLKVLHLATHLDIGGITTYIFLLGRSVLSGECEISVASSGGSETDKFQKAGIKTYELIPRTKSELDPRIYLAIPKVIDLIRREGFDLIHAHTRVTQVMAWCIQKLTGIPCVTTCHGFYKKRLGRMLLPAWGDRAIAISLPVADDLISKFHVPQNRVQTIFNAIDLLDLEEKAKEHDVEVIQKEWRIQPETIVIGIISRIVEDKGHEYLVRAIQSLIREYKNVKLLIVGEGPYKQRLVKLVQKLNLESYVIFTGNLRDVTKALRVIQIFVLPAIWREGFGLSIVEAMAFRIPVIVTNIWSLNALVQDKKNGLLIPPKDVSALENAIKELISNPGLADFIGKNGYETVRKEFSIDRMAAEVAHLYRDVISLTPGKPSV